MVKVVTTWKTLLKAPAMFWVSLFISSTVVNCVSLRAIADEVPGDVAISAVPQKASPVEVSATAPTLDNVTPVTQLTSNEADSNTNDVQQKGAVPATTPQKTDPIETSAETPILEDVPSVADLASPEGDSDANAPMSQVTNVSQLRDVAPGDWAYEALRSLVERYGCIAGYPNGTYRGNRATSRYEFAAGLNACLQQIERLITTGAEGFVTRNDLETLQRLIQEFQTELTTLGTRVDNRESRVVFLDEHQFSTTTKLNGLAWFNITGATAGRDVKVEAISAASPDVRFAGRGPDGKPLVQKAGNPNITLSTLTWLTFNTSFTGKDLLVTQLAAGNGLSPANQFASAGLFNSFGVPFVDQTAGPNNGVAEVVIHDLFYQFPIGDRVQLAIGPRVNWHRFFDANAFTFFLTGTSSFNSNGTTVFDPIDRGSGAVALININKKFDLHLGYLGENNEYLPAQFGFNTSSDPKKGLFSGTNAITAELTYRPSDTANIRLTYSRITLDNNTSPTGVRLVGGGGEPLYGLADDGQGGSVRPASVDAFGVNFDWLIFPKFGIFGRYGYATTEIDPSTPGRSGGNIDSQAIQFGLGFRDFGKEGALGTVSFLVPFDVLSGRKFLVAGGGNGGTQYEIEATYFYPLTNNIAIVPAFYLIANPNNFDDNPTIYVGNLRAQFSF